MIGLMSRILNIAVCGGTGYTGLELIKLLKPDNSVNIKYIGTRQHKGKKYSDLFPETCIDTECVEMNEEFFQSLKPEDIQVVFFATPNGIAYKHAPALSKKGINVIDLSADYRFRNLDIHFKWYGFEHSDKDANDHAVYGLVEFKKEDILQKISAAQHRKEGVIIANPGCYTTSSILALSPLLKYTAKEDKDLIDLKSIIVDGKSGISGAGRKAEISLLYSELNDSCSPYNLGGRHRHGPELEVFFSDIVDEDVKLTFSPHLIPMTRGLLTTNYVNFNKDFSEEQLREIYQKAYSNSDNIIVLDEGVYPKTIWAAGSNNCFIQVSFDKNNKRAIITSAIDNLIKGAAGQAIENLELVQASLS